MTDSVHEGVRYILMPNIMVCHVAVTAVALGRTQSKDLGTTRKLNIMK